VGLGALSGAQVGGKFGRNQKSGYRVAVSSFERDGDPDACPNCGARVESSISGPSEELREATKRRCPNCGKVLVRAVGGVWSIDETAS
jgi:ribosomal protein S27AE